MADKIKCLINNQVKYLSPRAFKLAQRFYDAVKFDEVVTSKPIELSRPLLIPKILKKTESEPIIEPEPVIEAAPEVKPTTKAVAEPSVKMPQTAKKTAKKSPAKRKK